MVYRTVGFGVLFNKENDAKLYNKNIQVIPKYQFNNVLTFTILLYIQFAKSE